MKEEERIPTCAGTFNNTDSTQPERETARAGQTGTGHGGRVAPYGLYAQSRGRATGQGRSRCSRRSRSRGTDPCITPNQKKPT